MVVISCVITLMVQRRFGAVSPLEEMPVTIRIGNALWAYASYIDKMIWPVGLSVYYPHPGTDLSAWCVLEGSLVVAVVSGLVLWQRRRRYLTLGWLWYLGTLVPVIGLVQVGSQAMADRYTYIPLIGVFIMIAWSVSNLLARPAVSGARAMRKTLFMGVPAVVIIIALVAVTRVHIGYWHDTISLYQHALDVTDRNHFAHTNLAQGLKDQERYEEAAEHYAASLEIKGWPEGYSNLGNVLVKLGRTDEAIANLTRALELKEIQTGGLGDENTAVIHYSMALALVEARRNTEAIEHLRDAIEQNPNLAIAHYSLGRQLEEMRDYPGAIEHYREALRIEPGMIPAQNNLAVVLFFNGDYPGAWTAVAGCRALGHEPPQGFLQALSEKMPEPTK
jgi:Flp pilus assembly protein TadD